MKPKEYRAYVVRETEKGVFNGAVEIVSTDELPDSELVIRVAYSSLNYKDALSASGNRGVTKRFPHIPGIDAAGEVVSSKDPAFVSGDQVVASCFDMGMNHPGGFAEYVSVPAKWVAKLPSGLSPKTCMMYGTAGFTAARCVSYLLENRLSPDSGEILVTGITGGVGSIAAAILIKLGYRIVGVSGKPDHPVLKTIGVENVITRDAFLCDNKKMLLKEKWAGVVDTVGGHYLETAIKQTQYDGVVTACGNAGGADLNISVYPFILRGVKLIGVDAAKCGGGARDTIWSRLANEWEIYFLEDLVQMITLDELGASIDAMLSGQAGGRKVIKIDKQ